MIAEKIKTGKTSLGIELGSTRIKACLIDENAAIIASGSYAWQNRFEDGYWTYSLEDIHKGVRGCFANLAENILNQYGVPLTTVGVIGISGMMHGYLAFDREDTLLVPFRTWRNTTTEKAARELTEHFGMNIPQRWSIAHLYQAILNEEKHVPYIAHITTIAGYIHYILTGKYEVGTCEASGIFPLHNGKYDEKMLAAFEKRILDKGYTWNIRDILPRIKAAGETGAYLTERGAKFLDPKGILKAGIPVCPPEGDAATGMVATNAVLPGTGNVSAGTSVFSMLVLEKPMNRIYTEIDMVTTPDGMPVAMVHCNNCSAEVDAWVGLFFEFAELMGENTDKSAIYEILYKNACKGERDCGGVVAYNYLSGEHITQIKNGSPMYFRTPNSRMTLANFFKAQLFSCFASLRIGMDILFENECVNADVFKAHGGIFKVEGTTQQILADALDTPICIHQNAGDGGAWGMALLALYMTKGKVLSLGKWLEKVFSECNSKICVPEEEGVKGFNSYITLYKAGISAEKSLEEGIGNA